MVVSAGVTLTDATCGGTATVIAAVPDTVPDVAVTVAEPLATAVTSPDALAVATPEADEVQVNVVPAIVLPFASLPVAVSCCVAPMAVSVTGVGVTVTVVRVAVFPTGPGAAAWSAQEAMPTESRAADRTNAPGRKSGQAWRIRDMSRILRAALWRCA